MEKKLSSGVTRMLGTAITLDLDNFEEFVKKRGLDPYKPNYVTATLSRLVEDLSRKWSAKVEGIDWERGTEEAFLEIAGIEASEVSEDLLHIANEIKNLGASITIVAVTDFIDSPHTKRRAKKILEKLKRAGGGVLWVDGKIYR